MSESGILDYLASIVNRTPDIPKILQLINCNIRCEDVILFICNDTTEYSKYVSSLSNNKKIELTAEKIPRTIEIDTENLLNITVENTMSVPINYSGVQVGLLVLVNKECGFSEELLENTEVLLSVLQMVTANIQGHVGECKNMFMANMSHEIRTPLNGIIGYNQLLMQTSLNSIQKNYLSSMRQCSIQLMQIINDILDFFKLSSGKISEDIESFRPVEIIESVKSTLHQAIANKKQKFSYHIDDDVPDFIVMDKLKITQIIMNLVSNANKFTHIGGNIMIFVTSPLPETMEIHVTDNGIGIKNSDQNKIFNPFEQLTTDGSKIGTGLGLAISKKLSKVLGGDLRVQSSLDSGSIFTLNVKIKDYKIFEQSAVKNVASLADKKILVVDDNIDNRVLLGEILFDWNIDHIMCASSIEALRMVQAKRSNGEYRHVFDMGLIDICMPNTGGVELAIQIKEELPLIPLIALSSVDSFTLTKEFETKVNKPVDKVQLLSVMYRVISNTENPPVMLKDTKSHQLNSSCDSSCFHKDRKILIAEDIIYNSNLLVTVLEGFGYSNITTVFNGKDAIDEITKSYEVSEPFEIILLDLRMPIKDGYDVIDEYNKNNWMLPKIIVVTASIMEEDRQRCREKGVEYFINKPIELPQLNKTMLYVSAKI
jgi:signal transduction histidine kinase/CheY-like chemotaxis protein